jgi:toxin ParE1/3/4
MTREVRRTPRARRDLLTIWVYVAADDEAAADRLLRRMERTFTKISEHPEMGRLRPELAPELRSFPIGSYVSFYRVSHTAIEIVRVLNGVQDLEALEFD